MTSFASNHPAQENRKHLWRILLPLGICTILALTGDLTLYAVLPAHGREVGFDLAAIGLMLSANRLVRLGSNPLVGLLLAGSRRKGFLLAGLGFGALSTLLYVLSSSNVLFLAGRLLWGISWSLINIGGFTMVLDAAQEHERGWASGVLQGFAFTGLALDPLLGGLLSDLFDFRSALLVCFALSASGFFIALIFLPQSHPPVSTTATAQVDRSLRGLAESWQRIPGALRALLHWRNAAANYVYFAANFISEGVLLSTLSLYLRGRYGEQIALDGLLVPIATAGGVLLALRAGVSALASPLSGSLSDCSIRGRWNGAIWGLLLGAGGLAVIILLRAPWALPLGVALSAAGSAAIVTIAPPLVREINPGQDGATVLGLLANSADLGMALAPLVTYGLLGRLSLEVIYAFAALMLVAGLPVIWKARG